MQWARFQERFLPPGVIRITFTALIRALGTTYGRLRRLEGRVEAGAAVSESKAQCSIPVARISRRSPSAEEYDQKDCR